MRNTVENVNAIITITINDAFVTSLQMNLIAGRSGVMTILISSIFWGRVGISLGDHVLLFFVGGFGKASCFADGSIKVCFFSISYLSRCAITGYLFIWKKTRSTRYSQESLEIIHINRHSYF